MVTVANPYTDWKYLEPQWKETRFEYDTQTGELLYGAGNLRANALTTDTDWWVTKYTNILINGNYYPTRIQTQRVGSWDNRASLSWS
jgi:hypothetical protein